jgi:hypothetical protein
MLHEITETVIDFLLGLLALDVHRQSVEAFPDNLALLSESRKQRINLDTVVPLTAFLVEIYFHKLIKAGITELTIYQQVGSHQLDLVTQCRVIHTRILQFLSYIAGYGGYPLR